MKIIEIKQTRQGEIAYLFDEEQGKVYKVWVEDMTGLPQDTPAPKRRIRPIPMPNIDNEVGVEDLPPARIRVPIRTPVDENVDDVLEDMATEHPTLPIKPRSMMPPGIAAIFRPQGSAGAAEETRRV